VLVLHIEKVLSREAASRKRKLEGKQMAISSFHDSSKIPNA
jgi:hypothetical protein